MTAPLILILLGPPGAGKGTQAKMLESKLGIPHISTGDLLRDHIRRNTELGNHAQTYMNKGQLVPDTLILDMLFDRVSHPDCLKGYILDGSPRTIPQADALQKYLEKVAVPVVINLHLADSIIIERLTQRLVCQKCGTPYNLLYSPPKIKNTCDLCGGTLIHRPDDTEAVITKRLKVYQEQTEPLIAYYKRQNLLHTIDCFVDKESVFQEILQTIKR